MGKKVQCARCGNKHERPVGRKCSRPVTSNSGEHDNTIVNELTNDSHTVSNTRTSTPVPGPSLDNKLEILAMTLNEIKTSQGVILKRIDVLEKAQSPNKSGRSDVSIWDTLARPAPADNGSSPTLQKTVTTQSKKSNPQVPLQSIPTLQTLRADLDAHAATTKRIEELEHLARDSFVVQQGKNIIHKQSHSNVSPVSSKVKTVKSGRDRVGGDDTNRVYVPWPQEFVYVGPNRQRVKYDELSQAQFTTGLLKIIEEEKNIGIQVNMIKLCAHIHQSIVDYSFLPVRGAYAVCLSAIEDGRVTWDEYEKLLELHKQYLTKTDTRIPSSSVAHSSNNPSNLSDGVQTRLCRNYNQGRCTLSHGHIHSGVAYSHLCSFCMKQGNLFPHTEQACKKRANTNRNDNRL